MFLSGWCVHVVVSCCGTKKKIAHQLILEIAQIDMDITVAKHSGPILTRHHSVQFCEGLIVHDCNVSA